MLRKAKNFVSRRIDAYRRAELSPHHLYAGDTYIVEFPKSGVTWLTMLVANSFALEHGLCERVTFGSVRRFIPDLHASRAVAPQLSKGGIRFYKSHATFNSNYANVIYLVRHPSAVMKSYHRYRTGLDSATMGLEKFIEDPRYGLPSWKAHIRSWIMTPRDTAQRQLHMVRYEDMLSDPEKVLNDLNTNLGWGLSTASIGEAIVRSDREEMRKQEATYRFHNPAHKMSFVGAGKEVAAIERIQAHVERECSEELKALGYL